MFVVQMLQSTKLVTTAALFFANVFIFGGIDSMHKTPFLKVEQNASRPLLIIVMC